MTTTPLQPGHFYHVFNRGNNREDLFPQERNYAYFLQLYRKYLDPVAETYAWCLLKNHFHLLLWVKTDDQQHAFWQSQPDPKPAFQPKNASRQFGHLFNAYAKAVNKATGRTGSLFEHPFHRKPIQSRSYLLQLLRYIHHNPQRHGLIDDFRLWTYSSYPQIMASQELAGRRETFLEWFGDRPSFEEFHRLQEDPQGLNGLAPPDPQGLNGLV